MKRLRNRIRQYVSGHRTRKYLRNSMMVFACIITFITTYTLILPALTLEKGALICGMEVHEHTENCYDEVLICTQQESAGHVHGEECYYSEPVLICEVPEHFHAEECFDEEGNLICEWEEHEHDENCYDEMKTLTCTLEESEGHIHDASCYEKQLVCGMEYHVHTQSCYEEVEETPAPAIVEEEVPENDPLIEDNVEEPAYEEPAAEDPSGDENGNENEVAGDDVQNDDTADENSEVSESSESEESSDIYVLIDETETDEETEAAEEESADEESSADENYDEETTEENTSDENVYDEETSAEETSAEETTEESSEETALPAVDFARTLTDTSGLWILRAENVWEKVDENTSITPSDYLMVRMAYNIPAGSLDAGNAMISYTLPKSILMDQERADYINNEQNYLNQIISGTRLPEETVEQYSGTEYLAGKYVVGLPSALDATLRAGISGLYATNETSAEEGWNLVCTFNEYSVYENATSALEGWLMFYVTGAELATDENGWGSIVFSENDAYGEKRETVYRIGGTDETESSEESSEEALEEESSEETSGEETSAEETSEEASDEETSAEETSEEETSEEETSEEAEETSEMSEEEKARLAIEFPAQTFEQSTGNVTVTVYAGTGAFPAGTTMFVEDIDDEDTVAAVVDAVNENADTQKATEHVLAADITFYDKDGQKIEPLIPIHVVMTPISVPENISQDAVPVIVHVDDAGNTEVMEQRDVTDVIDEIREEESSRAESYEAIESENESRANDNNNGEQQQSKDEVSGEDGNDNGQDEDGQSSDGNDQGNDSQGNDGQNGDNLASDDQGTGDQSYEEVSGDGGYYDEVAGETVTEASVEDILPLPNDAIVFDADSFSIYAVVYTVDFHWEVDGQEFVFSIPGGGFISLEHLVELLGIADVDTNSGTNAETGAVAGENDTEDPAADPEEESNNTYEQSINLNNIPVSEATKKFVAEVANVEFSSPELVWVGKVENDSTIGGLKEANGLEVQYSAELTDEQIAEINAQTVEAGDWALISVLPFTSEESMTVTMKNGEQFVVKVTDAQKPYKDASTLENGTYIIYQSFSNSTKTMYLKNNGTSTIITPGNGEALNANDLSNYTWQVTKNWNGTWTIKSTQGTRYINLYGDNNSYTWSSSLNTGVSLSGTNGIAISNSNKVLKRNDTDGFFVSTSGSGAGLTFYKIENNSSSGSSGVSGIELTDEERAEMEKWKQTLDIFNTLTDYNKTAEVFDENNRIYQIDITADSGITDFYKNVDLGLVLDVSNSMKFPSSLKALEDGNGNEQQVWMNTEWLDWAKTAYSEKYNEEGCFYIISDPALTSTIYKIWKDGNQWKYQDASENPRIKVYNVNDGTVFKEPYRQAYTLYYADDKVKRMTYLQNSVTLAIDTLKTIVKPTEHVDDNTATVQVAYNFFAGISNNNNDSHAIRKSQDFVNLRGMGSELFSVSPAGNEASGTRQDLALYDTNNDPKLAANEFGWHSGYDKYVILVTDGAPNGASMADVVAAANKLKSEDKVKLITIGLSTKDVDGGSQMLKSIADDVDGDGIPEFYEAEKAKDLEYILLRILRSIMAKGLVRGKVTDTIDRGFYPVDAQGNPLVVGVYKNGIRQNAQINSWVSNGKPTQAHQNEAFYTWEQIGDEWKITWYNQEIGWNDNDVSTGNPWTGTVYVKAKEDYLGGNLIETNDGHAQIEPTGIKLVINGTPETNWRPLENMPKIDLPIPRVNVHELETDENNTTFTIYKGAGVTPSDQIKALWDNIPIEEVVNPSEGGQHKRTSGASANVGTAGNGEKFSLGSLMAEINPTFNIDSLINQISATKSSASLSFEYEAYDHKSGTITVTVERTKGNKTPALHTADTVGDQVEQYQVKFTYTPYTETQRHTTISTGWNQEEVKDYNENGYHNGPNGRGNSAGTMTSTNTHTINVFQKGIRITKVDKTNTNQTLSNAVFELFRVDANGFADVSAYGLPSGGYSKVGNDLTTDANGIITINPVIPDNDSSVTNKTLYQPNIAVGATENVSHDTVFYLVEKTPPTKNGVTYAKMPGAIKFTMTLTEDKGSDSTATLYDWTQTAVITAEEQGNGSTVYLVEDASNTISETDSDLYAYMLKNGKSTDITLIKVDKVTRNSIGGAKFSLLRGSENVDLTTLTMTAITDGATITPEDYNYNNTNIKVVTIPEGGIKIVGLTDDTYTLREVLAPAGYVITNAGKTFKTENGAIKNADGSVHQNERIDIAFEVENEAGVALPNTGGLGTNLIYLLGTLLTVLANAGLVMNRRRRNVA